MSEEKTINKLSGEEARGKHHCQTQEANKARGNSSFGKTTNSRETKQSYENKQTGREEVTSCEPTELAKQKAPCETTVLVKQANLAKPAEILVTQTNLTTDE